MGSTGPIENLKLKGIMWEKTGSQFVDTVNSTLYTGLS